jgi:hypothetical protein
MRKLTIFIGLCGRCPDGYESSGRGESRWAQAMARCFAEAGHEIYMAPDSEECGWGRCVQMPNVHLYQPYQKRLLNDVHFDVAIFSSWQTEMEEALYIHADKYVWGVMSWKHEIMKDGFFRDNEFVARWFRADLPEIPYPINFKDRCFMIAQPFGPKLGDSRFRNKRIGWVAKEAFLNTTRKDLVEASRRHLFAIVEACKKTGASLSVFSCHEFDQKVASAVDVMGVLDKLKEISGQVTMYPSLPVREYWRELGKCSITVPVSFAGSIQESILYGVVPLMYRDSMFSNHPWIKGVCEDLTNGKVSRSENKSEELTEEEISDILVKLLTDETFYDENLIRLRPMVVDNIDSHVISQLNSLVDFKVVSDNIRR